MLSTDAFFDEQAVRTLVHTQFGGADFGECLVTMQCVPPGDAAAWHREWTATADRVAAIGDACAAAGHKVSAREAYLRASNYYRTSYLLLYGAPPTPHEMYLAFAVAANRRGYHCLLFDGPGQGRALITQGLTMRPDWETVIRPVFDYALSRPDVDPSRLALVGWSFGGYLALRGASGEPRLAACLADPSFMGLREPMQEMFADLPGAALANPRAADPALFRPYMERINASLPLRWKVVQRAFWVHGVDSLAAYLAIAHDFDNREAVRSIRCPVFVAREEGDPLAASAQAVYDALSGPKTFVRFLAAEGAGDHCAMMARSLFHQRMFDWLDSILTNAPKPVQ